jgi:hypothetical protein
MAALNGNSIEAQSDSSLDSREIRDLEIRVERYGFNRVT